MRRMLLSGAVAMALVATLGVHEASAQKGKDQRKKGNPIKIRLVAENLNTGESGRHITAAAGDVVTMTLRIDNRTGEAQAATVHILGGVPGCMYEDTVVEYFLAGEQKVASYTYAAPFDQSGICNVQVDVTMPKTGDEDSWDASVAFGTPGKSEAPSVSVFQRAIMRMLMRNMLDFRSQPSVENVTDLKLLFR